MPIKFDMAVQAVDDLGSIPGLAATAEAFGFDGLWATEVDHNPYVQLALASTTTERIELGTAIALSFTRSPMATAYACWDLAALTKGKFLLGLGTQVKAHNERRFSVPWSGPAVPRLREVIEAMRHIWHVWRTGEKLDYKGEYYSFSLMTPFFTPARHQYDIPIYIAGVNTGLSKLAGRIADGFHVHPLNSAKYLREVVLPAIQEGADDEGRSLDDISISGSVFVITGENDNQKAFWKEFVKQQISFYASTPSYAVIFDTHGWTEIREQLSQMARKKQWGDMGALISDEMLDTLAIVGEPDEIGAKLIARYDGLLDRITPYIPFVPGQMDVFWKASIETFANQ
ncbi:MAG: TIGR03617 family F420-dependent LLM class oxidoreductase [Chloroflexi bacterium]|nr:TIGR03617 family F420-dependent LLM class oxidoreductase [Chloroflexota bacterium]